MYLTDSKTSMIIGSEFSKKNQKVLKEIARLAQNDAEVKISVQRINNSLGHDRTEIKNILEHLQDLGYIKIMTIGGPLLYGHVNITEDGIVKSAQLD